MDHRPYFAQQMDTTFAEAAGSYRREYEQFTPHCRLLLQSYTERRDALYEAIPDFRNLLLELDELYVSLRNYEDSLLYAQGLADGLHLLQRLRLL